MTAPSQAGAVAALLPCPFCGATPVPSKTCIECDSCGTEGPVYMAGLIGAPVTQWNKRAATPAAVPVEALEGLLDKAQFLVDGLDEEYVAWPTRVLMLRAELTELTQLIKERSNG